MSSSGSQNIGEANPPNKAGETGATPVPVQEKVKEHEQNAARLKEEKESAETMKTGMPIAELEAVDS
ncbi:hypothetical protein WJX74_008529 [Apatococcus lobatus]|uniref:Uncharacterized protein n=1 Tax=Apatococcus lobatus TaxID=904363 RepID=A0AAW1R3I4_9CHLO